MISADDKDWTWVLERPCPECGFDASTTRATDVADLVAKNAGAWSKLLAEGAISDRRPNEATWSSLEYACHVRDVYLCYDARLELMSTEDDPLFPDWDQDASAVDDEYNAQDPVAVTGALTDAAGAVVARLDAFGYDAWRRPGRRSDGASFTVDTISRYMLHDTVHHIWDVTRPR